MTDMNEDKNTHEGALFALLESQAARHAKTLRILMVCWLASLVLMGSLFVCLINSAEEEETTTTEVAQEADNYGTNMFTHGDYYGSEANGKDN